MTSAKPSVVMTVFATLSGEALGRVALLGLNFFVANRLGASLYGQMGILIAAASLLQPLADLGLTHLALRNLSESGTSSRFPLFLGIKLVGSAAFLLLLTIWGSVLQGGRPSVGFLLAGTLVLVTTWGDFFRQILRARHMAVHESWLRITFVLGAGLGTLLMAHAAATPEIALLCLALAPLALCLGYGFALARGNTPFHASLDGVGAFVRQNSRVSLGSMAYLFLVAAIMRLDVWMANHFLGPKSTGAWLSAYNLVYAGAFLAQGLASIALPRLMDRESRPGMVLWKVWRLQIGLAAGLLAGVLVAGSTAFGIIFTARGFSEALPIIPLFGILLANSTLAVLAYHLFLATGKLWNYLALMVPAIAAKMLLASILTPRWGLEGMAISSLLSEGVFCLVTIWFGCRYYLDWRRRIAV